MSEIPTVKIKHPTRGFAIINQADYDEKVHKLFDAKEAPDLPLPTATELRAMKVEDLKAFLTAEDVNFPSDAARPQVLDLALSTLKQIEAGKSDGGSDEGGAAS